MKAVNKALMAGLLVSAVAGVAIAKEKPAAAAAIPPGGADPKNLSKGGREAIINIQKLQTAGDQAGALAAIRAARTAGNLNETDRFFLAQTELGAGQALKDDAVLEEALKESVATSFLPADQRAKYVQNLGALAYKRKDYTAATAAYEQYIQLAPNDDAAMLNLALLYADYKQNDKAVATLNKAIAAKTAKGEVAPETWYRQNLKIAFDNKMGPQTTAASTALIAAYPKAENWNLLINIYRDGLPNDDQLNLDSFRLMRAVGALGPEREYEEYASVAIEKGLPGEAKAVLDEGTAAKKIGAKPIDKELYASANKNLAADKAALPGLERDAPKAPNGKAALGTGDAYFGYGNYAKAAEMYKLAGTKGGVDAATANLRLGAALAMAGDKAGATAALQTVTSGPRAQLAQFWLIKVNGKA
jgi:hypothetical protein